MEVFKKVLMVLGITWLIGFITMLALGYSAYSFITSETVQAAATNAEKSAIQAHKEAELYNYYSSDRIQPHDYEDY